MMRVKEFEIPRRLSQLMTDGVWRKHVLWSRIPDVVHRASVTGNYDDPQWLDPIPGPDAMVAQIDTLQSLESEFLANAYGMRARAGPAAVEMPFVDVDRMVPILVSMTEFMVLLDYRTDPPRVVAPDHAQSAHGFRWKTIAGDVDSFLDALGI